MAQARLRFGGSIALSDLEVRCLRLYGDGWSRDEIARMASVSRRTVGATLTVAKEKLGGRTLAHAATILGTHSTGLTARPR